MSNGGDLTQQDIIDAAEATKQSWQAEENWLLDAIRKLQLEEIEHQLSREQQAELDAHNMRLQEVRKTIAQLGVITVVKLDSSKAMQQLLRDLRTAKNHLSDRAEQLEETAEDIEVGGEVFRKTVDVLGQIKSLAKDLSRS